MTGSCIAASTIQQFFALRDGAKLGASRENGQSLDSSLALLKAPALPGLNLHPAQVKTASLLRLSSYG
jgi:hypothetical protein